MFLLPISDYLRRMARSILSFTDIVKSRLQRFVEEVKSKKFTADQLSARAKILDDSIKHLLKIKGEELSKSGNKLIPPQLIPKHMHGQLYIKDIVKEFNQLYASFQQQARNPGQHKFLPDTVIKIIQCIDAIQGTLK